jgi:hypothetical protein
VKSSQRATASLAATPSQRGQPTSRGTVQSVAGRARRGSQAIGATIDSTLVAAASNITPMYMIGNEPLLVASECVSFVRQVV